jgi:hypothetical protein
VALSVSHQERWNVKRRNWLYRRQSPPAKKGKFSALRTVQPIVLRMYVGNVIQKLKIGDPVHVLHGIGY